jgi:hypothetical protein
LHNALYANSKGQTSYDCRAVRPRHRLAEGVASLCAGFLLQQGKYRCQEDIIALDRSSMCASATSASESQKVIAMARYGVMAVDSAARACSCVTRLSGRRMKAAKACSKHTTASRKAERVNALVPACC